LRRTGFVKEEIITKFTVKIVEYQKRLKLRDKKNTNEHAKTNQENDTETPKRWALKFAYLPTAVALCGSKWEPPTKITQLSMNTVQGPTDLPYNLSNEQRYFQLTVLTFGDVKANYFARRRTELADIAALTSPSS
jgi:hypothetical protein